MPEAHRESQGSRRNWLPGPLAHPCEEAVDPMPQPQTGIDPLDGAEQLGAPHGSRHVLDGGFFGGEIDARAHDARYPFQGCLHSRRSEVAQHPGGFDSHVFRLGHWNLLYGH